MSTHRRTIRLVSGIVFFLCILNVGLWFVRRTHRPASPLPEVAVLASSSFDTFEELAKFFAALARTKGAVYAYAVLREATLPSGTDTHLLGHVVGDELFRQKGKKGIVDCTDEFRNACSHAIVTGLFAQKGEGAFDEIAAVCKGAPGGSGAYTMCYHGLGHGVLVATNYDLTAAIRLCMQTGTAAYANREGAECAGGSVMELMGGGFLNPAAWQEARDTYLSVVDVFAPCTALFMPDAARNLCIEYLTPHLLEVVGADLASPTKEALRQAMALCEKIPPQRWADREACYRGFGKEFVGMVNNRDIRNVSDFTDEQLAEIYGYCELASVQEGKTACAINALNSLYWGGENDWGAGVRFCDLIPDPPARAGCISHLIGAVGYYNESDSYRRKFCAGLPEAFWETCSRQLLKR